LFTAPKGIKVRVLNEVNRGAGNNALTPHLLKRHVKTDLLEKSNVEKVRVMSL